MPFRLFAAALLAFGLMQAAPAAEARPDRQQAGGGAGVSADPPPVQVQVQETFNGKPFAYRQELRWQSPAFRIYRLSYPSPIVTRVPQNNTVPGDYYLPPAAQRDGRKRPAVVCLHILHGNFELERITCSVLASHGIPAIMMKLPYYGERAPEQGQKVLLSDPQLFLQALPQGLEDIRRTVDVLASRGEVNPEAIGLVGISLGGIVGATAAALEPRIARAGLILAGGDLEYILHHARESQELSRLIKTLTPQQRAPVDEAMRTMDPLTWAERLRDRAVAGRVLMVNAAEDQTIARPCTEKLAAALGIADRVVWLEGLGHYTAIAALPRVLQQVVQFFGQDLPGGVQAAAPVAAEAPPVQVLATVLKQISALTAGEPAEGRGHFVDLLATVTPKGGKSVEAEVRLVRGSGARFRLEVKHPAVGRLAVGQGAYPWLLGAGNKVFRGVGQDAADASAWLRAVDSQHRVKFQGGAGALATMATAPQLLEQLVAVTVDRPSGGPRVLRITDRDNRQHGQMRLVLAADAVTPQELSFDIRGTQGKIVFRQWQVDTLTPGQLFAEPAEATCQDVSAEDLHRMFAAVVNFALEQLP